MSTVTPTQPAASRPLSVLDRLLLSVDGPSTSQSQATWNASHRDELLALLWQRLTFPRIPLSAIPTNPEIVHAYVASHLQLDQFEHDAQLLIDRLQGRIGRRKSRAVYSPPCRALRVVDEYQFEGVPREESLFAELLKLPPAKVQPQLLRELRRGTEQLVDRLLVTFDQLVHAQVIGAIDWIGLELCRLYASDDMHVCDVPTRPVPIRDLSVDHSGKEVIWQTSDLMGVQQRHWDDGEALPPHARSLLEVVPEWLLPWVKLVQGERFRQGQIQCQLLKHGWNELPCKNRDEIRLQRVTGILLGDLLLATWERPQDVPQEMLCSLSSKRRALESGERHPELTTTLREASRTLICSHSEEPNMSQPLRHEHPPVRPIASPSPSPSPAAAPAAAATTSAAASVPPPASQRSASPVPPRGDRRAQFRQRLRSAQERFPWLLVASLATEFLATFLLVIGYEYSGTILAIGVLLALGGLFPLSLGVMLMGESQRRVIKWWEFVQLWVTTLMTTCALAALALTWIAPSYGLISATIGLTMTAYYLWRMLLGFDTLHDDRPRYYS